MPTVLPEDSPLRAYYAHGVHLNNSSSGQATAECPFCRKEEKFYVDRETGLYQCFVCQEKGNPLEFLRKLHEHCFETTTEDQYKELARERKYLNIATLMEWEFAYNELKGEWIVPGYFSSGDNSDKLKQLYHWSNYKTKDGKNHLQATPGFPQCVYGINHFDKSKTDVYITEGPWDALALIEILQCTKVDVDGTYEFTGNVDASLYSNINVIALPSASIFPIEWLSSFLSGRRVYLLLDNDHPKNIGVNGNTRMDDGAGWKGYQSIIRKIADNHTKPTEMYFLHWGKGYKEDSYNPHLKSGYDVRDLLGENYKHLVSDCQKKDEKISLIEQRIKNLESLYAYVESVRDKKDKWIDPTSKGGDRQSKRGNVKDISLKMTPCESWTELLNAWKEAMVWHDGLEKALTAMLSCVMSTMIPGTQLWLRVVGPPSCLSGETHVNYCVVKNGKIINHKGGSLQSLYRRFKGLPKTTGGHAWEDGCEYLIQSVNEDGEIVRNKVQDVIYKGLKTTYLVTTKSGRTIKATLEHEFLSKDGYTELRNLVPGDTVYVNKGKAQKKGKTKTIRDRKEVNAKYHPRARLKTTDIYNYKLIPEYYAVVEAQKNGLLVKQYLHIMNNDEERSKELWTIPSDMEVHHKDENPCNNSIDNLTVVSVKDHKVYHSEALRKAGAILIEEDIIVSIQKHTIEPVYDIVCSEPYRNFVANGIVVHNCGKSVLCDALCVNRNYVTMQSNIRGFFSGMRPTKKDAKEGRTDLGLIEEIMGKTFVTKDGDTIIQAPDRQRILAEARDLYDGSTKTHFRTGMGREYSNIRTTWILCGTFTIKEIGDNELGERFIDCEVIREIDSTLEEQIGMSAIRNMRSLMKRKVNPENVESMDGEKRLIAKKMTGGYIEYLCTKSEQKFNQIMDKENLQADRYIYRLGKFVSFMRARPGKQDEYVKRELSARLSEQLFRLAGCMAVVMGYDEINEKVLRRVSEIAYDTSQGSVFTIIRHLYLTPKGATYGKIGSILDRKENDLQELLRFLRRLKALDFSGDGFHSRNGYGDSKYTLSQELRTICQDVFTYMEHIL